MLQDPGAQPFRLGGLAGLHQAGNVCLGDGGVQLHQGLACCYVVAVFDEDALHHAALQGLDELGAVAHDDAARRHGNDVDLAEDGPDQCDHKQRHEREGDAPGGRVHGGLLQAQGCR